MSVERWMWGAAEGALPLEPRPSFNDRPGGSFTPLPELAAQGHAPTSPRLAGWGFVALLLRRCQPLIGGGLREQVPRTPEAGKGSLP